MGNLRGCVVEILEEPLGGEDPKCVARATIELFNGEVLEAVYTADRYDIPQDYKHAMKEISYLKAKIDVLEKTIDCLFDHQQEL